MLLRVMASFALDMREVGAGDVQSQLDLLKEIIGDLSNFGNKIFLIIFSTQLKT